MTEYSLVWCLGVEAGALYSGGGAEEASSAWGTVAVPTVQCSTVQYSAVQYSTVKYSTVQYSAAAGAHAAQVSPRARVPGEWRHSSDYNVLKALRLENNLALLKRVLQNQCITFVLQLCNSAILKGQDLKFPCCPSRKQHGWGLDTQDEM